MVLADYFKAMFFKSALDKNKEVVRLHREGKMTADDMRNAGVRTEKLSYAVQGTSFHFYLLSAKSLKLTAMPTPMLSKSAHILLHIHSSLIFLGLCIPFLSSGNLPDFHPQDGKPLDSFAYFRPFCVSKLFERIILSHLLFFLKLTPFFSPHQAGFRLVPCILNQIYIFLRFILDEFNKPKPGSQTILGTIDFFQVI